MKRHDDWSGGSGVNAGAGGAVEEAMLVWRVAMSSCSVWSRQMRPSVGVQSSTRKREIERSARQVDWRAQCTQMGESESVSQQEFSIFTGHGPRLAERAQMMLHAVMENGVDCSEVGVDRKAFDAHVKKCGDTRAWRV